MSPLLSTLNYRRERRPEESCRTTDPVRLSYRTSAATCSWASPSSGQSGTGRSRSVLDGRRDGSGRRYPDTGHVSTLPEYPDPMGLGLQHPPCVRPQDNIVSLPHETPLCIFLQGPIDLDLPFFKTKELL